MKNMSPFTVARASQREAIEARVAMRLAGRLAESTQQLPHDISERLRVARERAVEHARHARHAVAAASSPVIVGHAGGAAIFGATPIWLRLASLMPLIVLIVGLVLIQQYHDYEQIAVAAEIDAALLSDELPPTAYGDPGFAEYLRTAP